MPWMLSFSIGNTEQQCMCMLHSSAAAVQNYFCVSSGRPETLVRWGGKANHSIAYSLSNIFAKNYWNWFICIEVSVQHQCCFFETVYFFRSHVYSDPIMDWTQHWIGSEQLLNEVWIISLYGLLWYSQNVHVSALSGSWIAWLIQVLWTAKTELQNFHELDILAYYSQNWLLHTSLVSLY